VHGASVGQVQAGTRAAVNLGGVDVQEVARGDVLQRPGTLRPTAMVDVELALLPGARRLADGTRLRVHVASAEVLARVKLLGERALEAGARGLAQLRLESPAVAGRGDRLVLRSYSPAETIGGARVVDPLPPRRRAADADAVRRLSEAEGVSAAAEAFASEAGTAGIEASLLAARVTAPLPEVLAAVRSSAELLLLGAEPGTVLSREALGRLARRTTAALAAYHQRQPLKPGMPREELRARAFAGAAVPALDRVLADLQAAGEVRLLPDAVASARHEVRLSAGEEEARRTLVERAKGAALAGIEVGALAAAAGLDPVLLERVGRLLVAERVLDRVGDGLLVDREHLERLKREVRGRWPSGSRIEVAALKEMTGLSRKYVIPLLEYLDRERVTRRAGSDRVVL
jgi:selenocysteine-specific elongation factor